MSEFIDKNRVHFIRRRCRRHAWDPVRDVTFRCVNVSPVDANQNVVELTVDQSICVRVKQCVHVRGQTIFLLRFVPMCLHWHRLADSVDQLFFTSFFAVFTRSINLNLLHLQHTHMLSADTLPSVDSYNQWDTTATVAMAMAKGH